MVFVMYRLSILTFMPLGLHHAENFRSEALNSTNGEQIIQRQQWNDKSRILPGGHGTYDSMQHYSK
jgi:hypothetical protein